ncbi:MAG: Ca-activated chloride channel [Chthoniobacter sp.]|jgi:Ca-activated chloride channel family protein|nr:Ca-activated chloride channel [Chthoniobacter sp.]
MKLFHSLFCGSAAALLALLTAPSAHAAGLLIADGGFGGKLEIKEHDVKVAINQGIAVTEVTQVFHNTENRQLEALYTFPVPKGASVANFSMWINGKEMVGEVLEKKRARQIYETYKQSKRDPGLLEQTDFRTFEMRVFPIAAGADQKVQVRYYQELEFDHDWATYVYPLATNSRALAEPRTTGRFSIAFDIKSAIPIAAVESPSHGDAFVFAKHGESYAQASLEVNAGSLARDVVLAQHLTRPKTGLDVVTSARPGEDGFFCLTLTAGEMPPGSDDGMDYVFVLDISGSMRDDGKLLLSKDCLGAFISELGERDRFEVMTFNITPHPAFSKKRAADAAAKQEALAFLASAQANGGTVLTPAITTAYKYADADRPLNVVVLSDGLTEQSERRALLELIGARPRNAKVFCIGVGNDVNRPLLEQVASDSGGLASFLSHGDNFTRQAKAFRRKLMQPVATDLQIDFGGLAVSDLEPKRLPNLYHGAPVRLYGRYHGSGPAKVAVKASVNGVAWSEAADLEFPAQDSTNPEIERMWAWHRIDGLLKDSERTGSREAVVPEIVRLGEGFSIATEYTSFLVLENDAEFQRWTIARRNVDRLGRDRLVEKQREELLASLRQKSVAGLGPQVAAASQPSATPLQVASAAPTLPAASQSPTPSPSAPQRSQSRDFHFPTGGGGSGPVGPIFVALAAWLARRKREARA